MKRSFLVVLPLLLVMTAGAQSTSDQFTIIALPDTQFYSATYPNIWNAQTKWIAENWNALNIKFVLGLGDIVDQGQQEYQWQNADGAIGILDHAGSTGYGLPYVLALGNHDYPYVKPSATRTPYLYNKYFGVNRYYYKPYYRAHFGSTNENFYTTFDVNGRKYLVMALEFFPRNVVLDWAESILAANQDKEVIITMHAFLWVDGRRVTKCISGNAEAYGLGADNDGQEMWRRFRKYKNISLIINGHFHGFNARQDIGNYGNLITQMVVDYQSWANGGNGYLRIIKVKPSLNQIEVKSYSPFLNQWLTDSKNNFTMKWHNDGVYGTTGYIAGRVHNASTCSVVPGATITVDGHSVTTDSSGYFKIPAATGMRTAAVQAAGYSGQSSTDAVFGGYSTQMDFFLGSSSTSVNVTSPANGSTVGSPVHMVASASSSTYPVTAMQIYVDNTLKYQVSGAKIDTYMSLGGGSHYLVFKAWNTAGQSFLKGVTVNLSGSSAAVSVTSPSNGASLPDPVHLVASATAPSGRVITAMQIYVDNALKYQVYTASLNTYLTLAKGTRYLVVQAWDNTGAYYRSARTITVY